MKVAIVGAGIFGCTAAIELARQEYDVDLYDKAGVIMSAASACNQFRLHLGYHYPRSPDTVKECQEAYDTFMDWYDSSVIWDDEKYYAIAKSGSLTTVNRYIDHMFYSNLEHDGESLPGLFNVDGVWKVREPRIDYAILKRRIGNLLDLWDVNFIESEPIFEMREQYDKIIIAGYASQNEILSALGCPKDVYQYELVEKPVVLMPRGFSKTKSIVVMDGPFFSVDPYGETGYHLVGHVRDAIWAVKEGTEPPKHEYCDAGIIHNPKRTRWPIMQEAIEEFLPAINHADHIGSMFTVRAVLPDVHDTDERPTIVRQVDDKVISIFSGKIPTCVNAAREVSAILNKEDDPALSAA